MIWKLLFHHEQPLLQEAFLECSVKPPYTHHTRFPGVEHLPLQTSSRLELCLFGSYEPAAESPLGQLWHDAWVYGHTGVEES